MIRRSVLIAASLVLAATGLAACSTGATDPADGSAESASKADKGAFPVTVEHAYGSTEITEEPTNVATIGWSDHDVALSLGVVPVAAQAITWGGNEQQSTDWFDAELKKVGGKQPVRYNADTSIPFTEISKAAPDLILATNSGITEADYKKLSEIAPTVAYPEAAWTTPWRETVTIVGTALGLEDEAEGVLDDLDAVLAATAEEHPELAGNAVAAVWDTAGTFYVYTPEDSRVEFLSALGLEDAPSVAELQNGDSPFYFTLSYEQLDQLDSDLILSYHDTQAEADAFLESGPISAIPAVSRGQVAQVVGTELIAAVSPPTALSLTYGLDELVDALSSAVAPSS